MTTETCGRCPVHFEPGEVTFVVQSPGGARFRVCRECALSFDRWLGHPEKPQLDRALRQIRSDERLK